MGRHGDLAARCSAPSPPGQGPGALARILGALQVEVNAVEVVIRAVAVPDYDPGGWRPSSVVHISGAGHIAVGEHVGFRAEDHERFRARASAVRDLLTGHGTVAAKLVALRRLAAGDGAPAPGVAAMTAYDLAAVEAALVDLAMRQTRVSFLDLTGVARARLR
jgi:L-alanine-DL-glutamate epimerase-like enolase superfamily enzyme